MINSVCPPLLFLPLSLSHTRTKSIPVFALVDLPANLVLEDTVERIYHGNSYAENWHGLFLIRGENVVLLGEIVRCSHLALFFFFTPRTFFLSFLVSLPIKHDDGLIGLR